MKFIHAADIHLDSPLRGLEKYEGAPADQVRIASRDAFENLIALAIDESVAFVLLAGDLYDGDWPDYNTGIFFVRQMHRLEEAGITAHLVSGNHDAESQITKQLKLPKNVTHYDHRKPQTVVLDEVRVAIHGQSFPDRSVPQDLASGYPEPISGLLNIGLLHTSLDGRPGHGDYAPCNADTLRSKGYAYWALGHVHKREVVAKDPWIVFPGNLQGRHARETGPKGCTLVTVEGGAITEVEHRDVDVLRWAVVNVDVSNAISGHAKVDLVRDALQDTSDAAGGRLLAARLEIEGSSPAHTSLVGEPERWMQEYRGQAVTLGGAGVWLEKVKITTRRPADLAEELDREDALGDLLRLLHELEASPPPVEELAGELAELKRKLPPEITSGEDAFNPTDPQTLIALLPNVRELLLTRLLEPGSGS